MKKRNQGTTLVELMMVVAVLAVLLAAGPSLLTNIFKIWGVNESRVTTQRDTRTTFNLVNGLLREASAKTILLSRENADQPPYSKIEFSTPDNHLYRFFQKDGKLWFYHQDPASIVHTHVIAENLRFISFGFPDSRRHNLVSVAICFDKGSYAGQSKDFYLSASKVNVMNI